MALAAIKTALRNGKYAWPGGYPLYFITTEGEALSFEAVRDNWREVVRASLYARGCRSDWAITACEANYEDPELYCAHTGERIQSAYAEPD